VRHLAGKVWITHVSAGGRHSLARSGDGAVYSFGDGRCGQLGLGDGRGRRIPHKIHALSHHVVTQIAAGDAHSVFLTARGEVFTCGWGEAGQLGHGNEGDLCLPEQVQALNGESITCIAAGSATTLFAGPNGCWSCGVNEEGQAGQGEYGIDWAGITTPARIAEFHGLDIVSLSAGADHSAVVDRLGRLYTFGYGDHGCLGHGDDRRQRHPVEVKALDDVPVAACACGTAHTIILTTHGEVLTCGNSENGRLGHGDDTPQMEPTLVRALSGVYVTEIAAGSRCTLVKTGGNDSRFLVCGSSQHGELGCGIEMKVVYPMHMKYESHLDVPKPDELVVMYPELTTSKSPPHPASLEAPASASRAEAASMVKAMSHTQSRKIPTQKEKGSFGSWGGGINVASKDPSVGPGGGPRILSPDPMNPSSPSFIAIGCAGGGPLSPGSRSTSESRSPYSSPLGSPQSQPVRQRFSGY